jgi:hypothetical protein
VTAPDEVLTVHRADVDTPCRKCEGTIARGQRVALVAGLGGIHVRCLLVLEPQSEETTMTTPAETQPQTAEEDNVELAVKRGWDQ